MIRIIVVIGLAFLLMGCHTEQKKSAEVNIAEKIERVETSVAERHVPDSLIVSVAMQGDINRMDLLQQKVMHKAKVTLADSLVKLRQLFSDTTVYDVANYEVGVHDIHVLKEGIRYPDADNRSKIEAYITIGVKLPQ